MHDGRTELEVEVRLDALLGDGLGDSVRSLPSANILGSWRRKRERNAPLGVPTLELTSEEVAQPALEEGDDTAEEEEPNAPSWGPESDSRTLADGTRVEAGVDLLRRVGRGERALEGKK